jgi:GxxExxY protein
VRREPDAKTDSPAHAVIGAAIEVHRTLGPGFLENVYEEALAVELRLRNIPFERQRIVELVYKSVPIATHRLDLLVDRRLVVELKAVDGLAPVHFSQMISSLNATHLPLGLLINFAVPVLKHGIHRVVCS